MLCEEARQFSTEQSIVLCRRLIAGQQVALFHFTRRGTVITTKSSLSSDTDCVTLPIVHSAQLVSVEWKTM